MPSSDAATALSGPGNSFLKFESLTGVSLTIRGLQLEMNGVISKIEGLSISRTNKTNLGTRVRIPEVDLKAALSSLNMGESSSHAELGKKFLRVPKRKILRPRTIRQKNMLSQLKTLILRSQLVQLGLVNCF